MIWDSITMRYLHSNAIAVFYCAAMLTTGQSYTLQWHHNGRDDDSNHQPHHCLLTSLFRCRSKKTSKLRATGLCAGNSPVTGEFPAQMASNAENVSIFDDVIMKQYQCQWSNPEGHKKSPSSRPHRSTSHVHDSWHVWSYNNTICHWCEGRIGSYVKIR